MIILYDTLFITRCYNISSIWNNNLILVVVNTIILWIYNLAIGNLVYYILHYLIIVSMTTTQCLWTCMSTKFNLSLLGCLSLKKAF